MSPARALFLLTGLLVLAGCSGWHPTRIAPEIAPVLKAKRPVRATPENGPSVVLWRPRVVGDSLIGEVGYPPLRTAFALRDLRRLDVRGFSALRTGVAVVAVIAVGFGWLILEVAAGGGPGS